jgi:hypothetical protein
MGRGEMKGHRQIVEMRQQGMTPPAVFVFDANPGPVEWELPRYLPAVYVGKDSPALADMRFAAGLRVHLKADDSARAEGWVDRLLQDGAAHVIQSTQGEVYQWRQ